MNRKRGNGEAIERENPSSNTGIRQQNQNESGGIWITTRFSRNCWIWSIRRTTVRSRNTKRPTWSFCYRSSYYHRDLTPERAN